MPGIAHGPEAAAFASGKALVSKDDIRSIVRTEDRDDSRAVSDPQLLKLEMRLTWEEGKSARLESSNAGLKLRLDTVSDENQALKDKLDRLQDCGSKTKLHDDTLNREIAKKESALTMLANLEKEHNDAHYIQKIQKMELVRFREKTIALQARIFELSDEVGSLKMENQRVHSRNVSQMNERGILVQENEYFRAQIRLLKASAARNDIDLRLSTHLARLDLNAKTKDEDNDTIGRLSTENKGLLELNERLKIDSCKKAKEIIRLTQELRDNSVAIDKYKEAENKAFKLESSLSVAEAAKATLQNQVDTMHNENSQLWSINQTQNQDIRDKYVAVEKYKETENKATKLASDLSTAEAKKASLQHQVNTAYNENSRPKSTNGMQSHEIAALKQRLAVPKDEMATRQLKIAIANYITQLDIANEELRTYTCSHDSLSNIRDVPNATRIKPMWLIAKDIFNGWRHDKEFMKEFVKCREYVLKHHEAHQLQNFGRGEEAQTIQYYLERTDARRDANVTYRY